MPVCSLFLVVIYLYFFYIIGECRSRVKKKLYRFFVLFPFVHFQRQYNVMRLSQPWQIHIQIKRFQFISD